MTGNPLRAAGGCVDIAHRRLVFHGCWHQRPRPNGARMMISAVVLLVVAGMTVVWSFERILRKRSRSIAAYEVTAETNATYLARRSGADRLPARSHFR